MTTIELKQLVRKHGYKGVCARVVRGKKSRGGLRVHLYLPMERNGYEWNDAYRTKLNAIARELAENGWKWAADVPDTNRLLSEGNNAWTLFNGGEAITLTR